MVMFYQHGWAKQYVVPASMSVKTEETEKINAPQFGSSPLYGGR